MNITDLIFENLALVLFVDANPDAGWKISDPGSCIRDNHLGSTTMVPIATDWTNQCLGSMDTDSACSMKPDT
jgi:hypothetical protein